jgi:Na+-driven multidrug efflux pump
VEPLLLALRQPPLIAQMAARYLLLVIPTLPLMTVRETMTRYLITQQVATPGLVVNIITVTIAPLYSYVLLFR